MIRPILATLAMSACSYAPGPDGTVPDNLTGGNLVTMNKRVIEHDGPVRLTGTYVSNGTMWLGHPQACVTRGAEFVFHAPNYGGLPAGPEDHAWGVNVMAAHYPEPLAAWYRHHYAEPGWAGVYTFRTLTGADLIEVRAADQCPTEQETHK